MSIIENCTVKEKIFNNVENLNIHSINKLSTPKKIKKELTDTSVYRNVILNKRSVQNILDRIDDRLIVVIGPCSIHSKEIALEYAKRLRKMINKHSGELQIIMRSYFEKPRTTIGWKGLINDPDINNTCNIEKGLRLAREILLEINKLGVPVGCEFLDTISPQYISDLVSWGAIGARTTESQNHRQLASGLSMPIGFKNGTGGTIKIAVDAIYSSKNEHSFMGVNERGQGSIVRTKGNQYTHLILRGGKAPNYEPKFIKESEELFKLYDLIPNIMVDCSHSNSNKDYKKQHVVVENVCQQLLNGEENIVGVMIESNINEGKQSISDELKYGVSITDGCIGWEETEKILEKLSNTVIKRRKIN